MTDDQIKHMVDRFLGWRLPENFSPDAGISFERTYNEHTPYPMKHEPIGTNLFDAQQAEQMVRYMVEGMPCRPNPETQAVALAREHEAGHAAAEQSAVRFLKAHLATLTHTEAVADCLHCSLNYLISRFIDKHRALSALLESPRSPVEAVPVSALRELEAECRAEAEYVNDEPWRQRMYRDFADRLSAVIRGTKT